MSFFFSFFFEKCFFFVFSSRINEGQQWKARATHLPEKPRPLESHNPGHQKASNLFANYKAKFMHLKASVVPPNLTRDLEAKIGSQKTEISKSSKRSTMNVGLSEQLGPDEGGSSRQSECGAH